MTGVPSNVYIDEEGEWIEITWPIDPVEVVPLHDEAVPPEDWAPAPEFSDFEVWCTFNERWEYTWRPSPDSAWFCRECGSTSHSQRDTEEA